MFKVGDRARDRASGFTGTVVGLDLSSDAVQGVTLEADPSEADDKPENFGKPARLRARADDVDLIDLEGNAVQGKPGAELEKPAAAAADEHDQADDGKAAGALPA